MRRDHKLLPMRVALSPAQTITATGLHESVIMGAIESGQLVVHLIGDGVKPRKKILVADLEAWLRAHPTLIKSVTKR